MIGHCDRLFLIRLGPADARHKWIGSSRGVVKTAVAWERIGRAVQTAGDAVPLVHSIIHHIVNVLNHHEARSRWNPTRCPLLAEAVRSSKEMKIVGEIFRPEPQVLYLEPVFGCNYRCPFCIHGSGRQIEVVQLGPTLFEKLKPVIETVKHIHITGLGEPFLNPHLLQYLSYFREQGKSYYINTNGSLIQDTHIDLMTSSTSELSVSIDAGERHTYEKVRHRGYWDKVIASVKRVAQIKAGRGSSYPLLYLTFHINMLNLTSLKQVPELAYDLGINGVKLSWTKLPEPYRAQSTFRNQDTVNEILHDVSSRLDKQGIQVRTEAVFDKHVRGCWAFSPMFFVCATGKVASCCSRWLTIGDITNNDFEDIWNGMPRRKIALAVLNGRPEDKCRDCPQIRGVDYSQNEESFFKPTNADTMLLEERNKSLQPLPSLAGLDRAFRSGVAAFTEGHLHAALEIFSSLEAQYPDFFEIKNNLAVAHLYHGDMEKCRELFAAIRKIPHNVSLMRSNFQVLDTLL